MTSKKEDNSQFEAHDDSDFEYDEVRGAHGRKPKMAILNKTKLSKYEMDELFLGDAPAEES